MLSRFLGKKIGMTQIFTEKGEVVPVTVIDVKNWFVTQIKTPQKDGYAALQVGLPRKRYLNQPFVADWCKNKTKYFLFLREVHVDLSVLDQVKIGQEIKADNINFSLEDKVKVSGRSIGLGFQGVVKRWGFGGGPKTHGSCFHRIPGAISGMRTQGEVIKGKKLPGHTGDRMITMEGLKVISFDKQNGHLFVKGAVPGKKDSLLMVCKQG